MAEKKQEFSWQPSLGKKGIALLLLSLHLSFGYQPSKKTLDILSRKKYNKTRATPWTLDRYLEAYSPSRTVALFLFKPMLSPLSLKMFLIHIHPNHHPHFPLLFLIQRKSQNLNQHTPSLYAVVFHHGCRRQYGFPPLTIKLLPARWL